MSQYAFGRYLSIKNNTDLKLDLTLYKSYKTQPYLLDQFNIVACDAIEREINMLKGNRILKRIGLSKKSYVLEKSMVFDKEYMNTKNYSYLEGYWGSELYFKDISDILQKDFTLKNELNEPNRAIARRISDTQTPVSVHFRRGDYVTDPKTNRIHGTCSLDYYNDATNYIIQKTDNPNFYVFSDDILWAKNHFDVNYPTTFVDINGVIEGHYDIYLMSQCHHHIIANSSFSWWGAWLGHNPNKIVISPSKWFKVDYDTRTLLPKGWIKL